MKGIFNLIGHYSVLLAEIDHENEHYRRISLAILQETMNT